MKKLLLLGLIGLGTFSHAQNETEEKKNQLYVKANAAFLPIGILNAGVEYQLNKKYTFQADVFYSPWESFAGHELNIGLLTAEGRYYFKEAFKGWYLGANITGGFYKIQKWNYWKNQPYINEETGEPTGYNTNDLYQKGFNIMVGVTGGYQFRLAENWNMDIFLALGNSQSFYKGYVRTTGERYDKASGWNKSGEWIPYRGGIMISYKLK